MRKVLGKCQPEDKRAEIVQGSHAPDVLGKDRFTIQLDVFTTLVLFETAKAPVNHAEKIEVEIGFVAGPRAEGIAERPSPLGEVFCAHRGVHASINRPVERFAQDCSLAR